MGKHKRKRENKTEKEGSAAVKQGSDRKLKRDAKPKKAKVDHLEHIPFKLQEIMKSKEAMKTAAPKAKKAKEAIREQTDGGIPVPHFKRRKRESVKAYVRRMENETKHVLFLSKNQVDRRPELDMDNQGTAKGKSEKKREYDTYKLQRLHQKKLDRQEAMVEKEMFVDNVPFGEVAMAPPSLNNKPRKAQVKSPKEPKTLLLNSLLGHTVSSTNKPSMARQRMMEEERERVVQAYRKLKKQKQQQRDRMASLEKPKNLS